MDKSEELEAQMILGMQVLGFPVDNKDILLVKRPVELDDDKFREGILELAVYLHQMGIPCTVFGVEEFDDLQLLTIQMLNNIGLYHKDQILMLKKDMPDFDKVEEEE